MEARTTGFRLAIKMLSLYVGLPMLSPTVLRELTKNTQIDRTCLAPYVGTPGEVNTQRGMDR